MAIRILATSNLYGSAVQELGARFPELLVTPFRSPEWDKHLPNVEALVITLNDVLTIPELDRAKKLKAIGTFSVGLNHLPLPYLAGRNIRVANTPGVLTDDTADITVALLLCVARRVAEGDALIRSGGWKGWTPDFMLGTGLSGKVCGILGSGPIGRAVAKRVSAFGMDVLFWDRAATGEPVDFGSGHAERLPLDELLAASQVLCLNCPLTDTTRNLLTREKLLLLPKGALLINAARGGIVDENAAIDLLESGHLGGAGFDVFENEPAINPRWLKAPRALLLPHLGSATAETRDAMARLACKGVAEALSS